MATQSTTKSARILAPLKAKGRTLAEFAARGLWPAERELIDACREGRVASFNGGDRPEKRPTAKDKQGNPLGIIRGDLLRFLSLGGDDRAPVHERGVQISGAWIETGDSRADVLDLDGCLVPVNLGCAECTFDGSVSLSDANCQTVSLRGSALARMTADRLKTTGGLFLDQNFKSTGEVRLLGAQIGRNLSCRGGRFDNAGANALVCDGIAVKGGIFLGQGFTANGEVRLLGAEIGGDLDCRGGQFDNAGAKALSCDRMAVKGNVTLDLGFTARGEVRLLRAKIGGNIDCEDASFSAEPDESTEPTDQSPAATDRALNCDGMTAAGSLFFRDVTSFIGLLDFSAVKVGELVDDKASWDMPSSLILDGFTYGAIADGPTDAETRIAWLRQQHAQYLTGTDFRPQPWMQLIRTLRRMGHREAADDVAVAFQQQLHQARKTTPLQNQNLTRRARHHVGLAMHMLFGALVGYGYKPLRLVAIMLMVWLGASVFYLFAAISGGMGPSNPLVFQNPAYVQCRPGLSLEQAQDTARRAGLAKPEAYTGNWYYCGELPGEYTTFQPFLYSLDLILPLVELQQDKDWSPIIPTPTRHPTDSALPQAGLAFQLDGFFGDFFTSWSWGQGARVAMWFQILFGWVASLLLVAVLTGLTNREKQDET